MEISKKDFASLWHSSWKSALCIAVRNLCSISPIFAVKFRCKRENEKPWLFRWSKRSLRLGLKVEKHLLILSSKGENSPCWTSAKIGLGNKDEARRRLLADHTCWRKVIFLTKTYQVMYSWWEQTRNWSLFRNAFWETQLLPKMRNCTIRGICFIIDVQSQVSLG